MASPLPEPSPTDLRRYLDTDDDDEDADTASQRSISLSSPPASPRHLHRSALDNLVTAPHEPKRESHTSTLDTDVASEADGSSMFRHSLTEVSPSTSAAPSLYGEDRDKDRDYAPGMVYPPSSRTRAGDDSASISSWASGSSRKTRPESLLVTLTEGQLILGIALVDFNHLIGPRIEFSKGEIMEDEEVAKILPFLALPDGAHLSAEDYSYFHLVSPGPNPTTVFGISCNQQIAASALLVKGADVTRSIVQKAVVVLASKPVFGPIRAKLGVVTTALFNQRDFTDQSILDDFSSSLELSLRGQLTESGLYMGTSIRELVHTFRQRTLVLVKALMLQKRIMFYGHPVERLCTYQYSLVSLIPGLLQALDDSGSSALATRAPSLQRATTLRTSDHKSMMAYMGLPLDIFGKEAFFQPYLPLQQLDALKETGSWLCGCTNSIVTARGEVDLLVNIETGSFEFRDARLERSAGLTPADRKWMDGIIQDVNEGWSEGNSTNGLQFKGSDDYLRTKFEEYIFAALASVRYQEFVSKGEGNGVIITGGSGGDSTSTEDFNPLWISEFKKTNAYEVWERITDPVLFDIVEPRHPCTEKPSVVTDIGIRLQEGIQDLRLEQQLAPAREAVANALSVGSTGFFKAVEGVRERWAARAGEGEKEKLTQIQTQIQEKRLSPAPLSAGLKPFSLLAGRTASGDSGAAPTQVQSQRPVNLGSPSAFTSPSRQSLAGLGAGMRSFWARRASSSSSSGEAGGGSRSAGASPVVPALELEKEKEKEKEGGESGSLGSLEEREERDGWEGLGQIEKEGEKEREDPSTPMAKGTPWVNLTSLGGATPKAGARSFGAGAGGFGGLVSPTTPTPWGGKGKEGRVGEEEVYVVGVDGEVDGHGVVNDDEKGKEGHDQHRLGHDADARSTRPKVVVEVVEVEVNEEDAYTGMAL